MKKSHSILAILSVLIAASLACSMPLAPAATPTSAITATPHSTGTPSSSPLVTVTTQPALPANTVLPPTHAVQIVPSATSNSTPCNLAVFEGDSTYVDDTVVPAGSAFVKKWRLRNAGSCTWTSGYKLIFVSGDAMSGSGSTQLTNGTVPSGSSMEAAVNLVAPAAAGTYRGNYKLQSPDGIPFGIDPAGSVFYVRIVVEGQNGQQAEGNPVVQPSIPELTRNLKLTSPYMTGGDVTKLQKKLLARGYSVVGSADGIFGNNTDKGVRQFQADQGLIVDGIVGQKTWGALWS